MDKDYIEIPEPARSTIDFVCEEDRRYFEDHPKAKHYDRRPLPEEFYPVGKTPAKGWMIRVYQLAPGVRIRALYPEGGKLEKSTLALVKKTRKICKQVQRQLPETRPGRSGMI